MNWQERITLLEEKVAWLERVVQEMTWEATPVMSITGTSESRFTETPINVQES